MTLRYVFRVLRRHRGACFAVAFLIVLTALALLAPLFPVDPNALDLEHMMEGPSSLHWFGTDELGRDYFIRSLYGARVSLFVGVLAMLTALSLGVIVGLVSGYFGGWVDEVLMRLIDVLSSIPWIILVTVVGLFLKRGLSSIIIVIGIFGWMSIARLVRAEVLSLKEREYVQYAQFIHTPALAILRRHLLPGVLPTIITSATSGVAGAILTESSLSFLGLGVQQPMSSLGSMLTQAQATLQQAPYMAIIPGLIIFLTIYSFNKLGDVAKTLAWGSEEDNLD
ncbi:ABC transporter permease [Peptoniphilus equinus]|uniref:ABC transporter permease n=1 Tax=Peptoniphilus equinus TaxID=3016343 RepID=A0ABY7QVJ8_9FIRM|nr:ABC transporter permease [Peptoniphilus equinus]WBW49933.1 ABC transporter permease [Peptoniphilus equinus]